MASERITGRSGVLWNRALIAGAIGIVAGMALPAEAKRPDRDEATAPSRGVSRSDTRDSRVALAPRDDKDRDRGRLGRSRSNDAPAPNVNPSPKIVNPPPRVVTPPPKVVNPPPVIKSNPAPPPTFNKTVVAPSSPPKVQTGSAPDLRSRFGEERRDRRDPPPPAGGDKKVDAIKLPPPSSGAKTVDRIKLPPPAGGDKKLDASKFPSATGGTDAARLRNPGSKLPETGTPGAKWTNPPGTKGPGDSGSPGERSGRLSDVQRRLGQPKTDPPKFDRNGPAGAKVLPKTSPFKDPSGKPQGSQGLVNDPSKFTPGGKPFNKPIVPVKSREQLQEMAKNRFPERLKSGQLEQVTKGEVAQKLKLSDQYKLSQQGDVARRLQLQKNVTNLTQVKVINKTTNITNVNVNKFSHHDNHYRGRVSPHYHRGSFEFNYWGPSFFAGVSWYPRWSPWVGWSWGYHCHPIWDPRPLWCRPVIYDPCPAWVYYPVPVWTPLPVATSGTWVDVPPVAVAPQQFDLQMLAVRFVDPGHPEEKLGPRFRVWFRNNSPQPITQPFNVVALASLDGNLVAGLPQAGVRVASMDPGDTQSVDIRLPFDVYNMGQDAGGRAVPFARINVLVDANREVPEAARNNNGAALAVAEVLPVDPASFEMDPANAAPGGEVLLAGEGFGPEPGQVLVHIGGRELEGEISGWYDLGVKFKLPAEALVQPTAAEVIVVRGDGAAANPLKMTVLPR